MKGYTKQRHESLAFCVETYAFVQNKWYASILTRIALMISTKTQLHGRWEELKYKAVISKQEVKFQEFIVLVKTKMV